MDSTRDMQLFKYTSMLINKSYDIHISNYSMHLKETTTDRAKIDPGLVLLFFIKKFYLLFPSIVNTFPQPSPEI